MSIFSEFAQLIGVAPRHAEDALHSERCARATLAARAPGQALSRRGLFGAAAALAAGTAFGFPAPVKRAPIVLYFDTDSVVAKFYGGTYEELDAALTKALAARRFDLCSKYPYYAALQKELALAP